MLNANEPERYATNEVLALSRAICKQLRTMPDAFLAQGVFRVSGTQQHIMQIINDILRHKKFVQPEYTVHDYVGALKYALINANFLAIEDPAIQTLKAKVATDDIAIGQLGIQEFIETLADSSDKNQFMVAEIFYDFMHQLTSALAFQDANKMSSVNLGIIAGPFFATLVEDNPKRFLDTTLKFNQMITALISAQAFKPRFEDRFPKAVEAWRERELIELETSRSYSLRRSEKHAISASSVHEAKLDKKKLKTHDDLPDDEIRAASHVKPSRRLFFFHKKPKSVVNKPAIDQDSSFLSKLHLRRKKT